MNHEEKHLRIAKDCPICSDPFEQGMEKFWNDRDYVWLAWCKKCSRHIAIIMGELEK